MRWLLLAGVVMLTGCQEKAPSGDIQWVGRGDSGITMLEQRQVTVCLEVAKGVCMKSIQQTEYLMTDSETGEQTWQP